MYGHPKAGDLWADKTGSVLTDLGFETIDGWPPFFIKRDADDVYAIDVYVDDLIMYGPRRPGGLRSVIKQIGLD